MGVQCVETAGHDGAHTYRKPTAATLRDEVKEAFSRWHRFEHNSVLTIEHDVMLALERAERASRPRDMPCFCGTPDAYRCPAHINPVQFTSGGR